VERISRFALILEAVALAVVTLQCLGGIVALVLTGAHDWHWKQWVVVLPTFGFGLLALYGGWKILVTFLRHGRPAAQTINPWWWRVASAGAVVSVIAGAVLLFDWFHPVIDIASITAVPPIALVAGVLFVPTFVHLSAEVWLRAG
jgi:hypothetical protein